MPYRESLQHLLESFFFAQHFIVLSDLLRILFLVLSNEFLQLPLHFLKVVDFPRTLLVLFLQDLEDLLSLLELLLQLGNHVRLLLSNLDHSLYFLLIFAHRVLELPAVFQDFALFLVRNSELVQHALVMGLEVLELLVRRHLPQDFVEVFLQ